MAEHDFSWTAAFHGIARRLNELHKRELEGREQKDTIDGLFKELFVDNPDAAEPFALDGDRSNYEDIDPYSFLNGIASSKGGRDARCRLANKVTARLGVAASPVTGLSGVRKLTSHKWFTTDSTTADERNDLWTLLDASLAFSRNATPETRKSFISAFDAVSGKHYPSVNNYVMLTAGIFWTCPGTFPQVDSAMREYLTGRYRLQIPASHFTGARYIKLADELKDITPAGGLPELVCDAYRNKSKANKPAVSPYWWVDVEGGAYSDRPDPDRMDADVKGYFPDESGVHPPKPGDRAVIYEFHAKKGTLATATVSGNDGLTLHLTDIEPLREPIAFSAVKAAPVFKDAVPAHFDYVFPLTEEQFDWVLQGGHTDMTASNDKPEALASTDVALNTILYGPPGTGKTYSTIAYAVAICEDKPVASVLAEMREDGGYERVRQAYEDLRADGRVAFVTFHQSYGYEEFVEGIRPVLRDDGGEDGLSYALEDGAFKEFCGAASETGNRVFIIDEINRGNISKIFGELITLIEDTKRTHADGTPGGMEATLPYSKEPFSVPDNVYLLGTMNTADRSIAMMDTALRRRFTFVEMQPDPSLLRADVAGVDLPRLLATMNARIDALYDREHTIGHAYLMGVDTLAGLDAAFDNKIVPLLQEYFFDDYGRIRLVLGRGADAFVRKCDPKETRGLFEGSDDDFDLTDELVRYRVVGAGEAHRTADDYIRIYGGETSRAAGREAGA